MEFEKTPRFWHPRVARDAWIDFSSRTVELRPSECRENFSFSSSLSHRFSFSIFSIRFFFLLYLFVFLLFLLPFTPSNWSQKLGNFPPLSSLLSPPHTCLIYIFFLNFFSFPFFLLIGLLSSLFFSLVLSHRIIFCLTHSNCFLI